MRIGIIGAGKVGTGLGKRLIDQRHDVLLSFSRNDAKLAEAAADAQGLGPHVGVALLREHVG